MKRLLIVVVCALALGACRLDISVSVEMQPDGTGTVSVTAVADQELLAQVPDVLDQLEFDDAVANGWTVGEPVVDADGNATLELAHPFSSAAELANLLNSIGPPLSGFQTARTPGSGDAEGQVSNAVVGELALTDGFASFADSELTAALGGLPFGDLIEAAQVTPDEAMSVTLRVDLPGEVVAAPSGREVAPGVVEWQPPLDGSTTAVDYQTVQRPAGAGNAWAGPLSTVALIALIAWVVVAAAFITFVVVARRNRQRRRRESALRRLR